MEAEKVSVREILEILVSKNKRKKMSLVYAKIKQRRETLYLLQNLKMKNYFFVPMAFAIVQMVASAAYGSSVKITPLGSHDGEFCRFDRALIFEDPNRNALGL